MPSPVGHALGGIIVGLLVPNAGGAPPVGGRRRSFDTALLGWAAVAACLPDLDFLWGRHNMETHSVGFAALAGAAALLWARSWRVAAAVTLAVLSHVLFDWLGSDDAPPLGVMALWPLTDAFYFADAFVFEAISRQYWKDGFVRHNVLAIVRELALLLPVYLVAWLWRARRRHS